MEHKIEDTSSMNKVKDVSFNGSSEKKRLITKEERKGMFSINIAECHR